MRRKGILSWLCVALAVSAWGVTFASTRFLLGDFSPLEILVLRFSIAFAALWIVCLGDSIVNDTCSSKFELLLQRMYPKCKVTSVRSVRSATGCWWYKDDNRVEGWVFSHKPDLLLIGGVSQRDDVESIRSVIRQCRAKDPGLEMLIMTPVFGEEGSLEPFGIWNVGWNYDPDKAQHPFRRQLRDMCAEERVAFFDINAPWRQHILDSGKDVGYYHRDRIHSNARGQVILGKLIEKWFSR